MAGFGTGAAANNADTLRRLLDAHDNNVSAAADAAHVHRSTLYRLLAAAGVAPARPDVRCAGNGGPRNAGAGTPRSRHRDAPPPPAHLIPPCPLSPQYDLVSSVVSLAADIQPNVGAGMLGGFLRSLDIAFSARHVARVLREHNPIATALRATRTVSRRAYDAHRAMYLLHQDACCKLERYGWYIHGAIDGFSRFVVWMRATNNKLGLTPYTLFIDAIARYGAWRLVRGDHGSENKLLAAMCGVLHDLGGVYGAHMKYLAGLSVNNQRIERLWGDLPSVLKAMRVLLESLEREGVLDVENPVHRFALDFVYLPILEEHLALWREMWNNHPVRTAGAW